ncbi:MAG: hypothetical protein REI12_15120, partial [Pedobacter sp.]|nr:hypothetical protein [Pedobacter sp.]
PDTPLWEIGPFKKSLELGAGYMKLNNAPAEKREAFWEEAGSMLDAMAATCTANPDWEFRKVLSQHMGKYLPYLYAPPFAKKR